MTAKTILQHIATLLTKMRKCQQCIHPELGACHCHEPTWAQIELEIKKYFSEEPN